MGLMLAVVACYTICSLSDKYAVANLKMNGNTLTFIMAAATSLFMLAYLPFDSRHFDGSFTAFLANDIYGFINWQKMAKRQAGVETAAA